jgi:hypothetical protein
MIATMDMAHLLNIYVGKGRIRDRADKKRKKSESLRELFRSGVESI